MGDPPRSRPTPTASGILAKTPVVNLLVYMVGRRLGGSLELFATDKRQATVLFAGGEPLKVRTSEPVAYLGKVLQELGHVDEQMLSRSVAELAKRKALGPALHGMILLEWGAIDLAKLRAGLSEQIGRKLHHLASLPGDTAYAYYDGVDLLKGWGGDDSAAVDPIPDLWSMIREYPPWDHVNAALARVAGASLRLAEGSNLGRLRLAKEEVAAVESLRSSPLPVGELAKAATLNERTAQLLTYLLLVTKHVDILPVSGGRVSAARISLTSPNISVRPPPLTSSPPPARVSAMPPPPPELPAELAARWKEITDRAVTIDRADYFMMLDLARDATRDDVEGAFFQAAKHWHPDRLPPELAPVREACSRVFGRMSEARSTLTDDEQRARYMRLLSDGSGSPETQDAVAKVIESAQHFQKAEVFFKRNDLAQAETFCQKAYDGDPTQPDYLALLAWLEAQKPASQTPEKTLECIRMLDRAASMSARCEKAFYWRGLLYKRLGKADMANKDFRRVVDLNPRNIDAAREVRLQNMRGSRASTPPPPKARSGPPKTEEAPKGGLFGRLFKKS
ncbi:MAG TPA: DnaJ domain-containing protein [Polyangiaceae bacterium]